MLTHPKLFKILKKCGPEKGPWVEWRRESYGHEKGRLFEIVKVIIMSERIKLTESN